MSDLIKRLLGATPKGWRRSLTDAKGVDKTLGENTTPEISEPCENKSPAQPIADSDMVERTTMTASADKSLFANVAMELRTPLTLILSPLESLVMGEYGSMNVEQAALLKTIHNQSVKLLQIVSGMSDLSNMQSGIAVSRQIVDVGVLTGAVVSELNSHTGSRDYSLVFDPHKVHIIVSIDRYLFERIVSNLIANAVKNCLVGSVIKVTLKQETERERLLLSVAYTPISVEDQALRNLIQDVKSVDERSGQANPAELDLELVRECTALLSGVLSTKLEGTTCCTTVDLLAPPVQAAALQPPAQAVAQQEATVSPRDVFTAPSRQMPRVLIVENSSELAQYMQGLLGDMSQCQVAADGEAALEIVREWSPDLVLAAVMLPKRDGLSLCREIKSKPETSLTTVVLLTALTHRQSMLQGWEAGADEYLFKPFHPAELVTRIRSLLRSVQQRKRAQEQIERLNEALEKRVIELANANRELKSLAIKLEQARDQALEASRFKSAFLANMSHEVRTPINGVISMSDMLMRTRLSDEQVEISNIIKDSAAALLDIVNDILDFSKIEAGKVELEIVDFELLNIVEGTAELVAEQARQKKLSLMTYVAPDVPISLRGDPGRLRQILLNLLSNAIKFTESGEVIVQATLDAKDEKRCRVRFSVTDTGIGMPQEAVYRLFQPFTQADGSITRRYGGTGLGLSIAKLLVELLGGRVGVRSTEGKGSTFWFSVPLDRAESKDEPSLKIRDLTQTRILVVDPLEGTARIIQDYISSWGMNCCIATSAMEALAVMREAKADGKPFHIVMVEFQLPDLHSFEFARAVAEDSRLRDAKLILCTAEDKERLGEGALLAGFSAFLVKPLRQSRLYDCLVLLLDPDAATKSGALPYVPPRLNTTGEITAFQNTGMILIAEDNPVNQKVALLLLKELGFSAHVVGSGSEAVEAVNRAPYALILMDCQMPDMDGFEATGAIRRAEALTGRHIPIIAMTAHAMQGDREKCIASGMDDYVSKPVTGAKLKEVLVRWFRTDTSAWRGLELPTPVLPELKADDETKPEQLINYDGLKETCGPEGACELIGVFISSTDTLMERLAANIQARDSKTVKATAHEMKGATASMGSTIMSSICKEIEAAALAENWPQVSTLYTDLGRVYEQVQEHCRKILEAASAF